MRNATRLAADQRLVWETLTDYVRLREFVPGVTRAHVLARAGNQLSVEQFGAFSVFIFDLSVKLRLTVLHSPYSMVLARLEPGSIAAGGSTLRSFSGRYTLMPLPSPKRSSVRLDYDAQFELAAPLPPVVGRLFGVSAIQRSMREIERRQARLAASEDAG